jgi:hypothetical protein
MVKETDPSIMEWMFSTCSKTSRVVAAWLPLCLVWVFVACVSLCAAQADACEKPAAEKSSVSHEARHCPVTEALNGVLPERQRVSPQVIARETLLAQPEPSVWLIPLGAQNSPVDSSSDPPLKLLRMLRI